MKVRRNRLKLVIGLLIFCILAVIFELKRDPATDLTVTSDSLTTASTESALPSALSTEADLIPVYLVGAVARPGIYRVPRGSYLFEQAGGLTEDAAAEAINLALSIEQNNLIRIPTLDEVRQDPASTQLTASAESQENRRININTAGLTELDQLPGIGPATAKAIVDYRDRNGPFASREDLMKVPGIKRSRYEALSDLITVS